MPGPVSNRMRVTSELSKGTDRICGGVFVFSTRNLFPWHRVRKMERDNVNMLTFCNKFLVTFYQQGIESVKACGKIF